MTKHLDRLFTQAMATEAHRAREFAEPAATTVGRHAAAADDGADEAPLDPTATERVLDAFTQKDYAACLGLPAVMLDDVGAPCWPVSDR